MKERRRFFLSLRLKELKQKQEIIEVRRKTMFNVQQEALRILIIESWEYGAEI